MSDDGKISRIPGADQAPGPRSEVIVQTGEKVGGQTPEMKDKNRTKSDDQMKENLNKQKEEKPDSIVQSTNTEQQHATAIAALEAKIVKLKTTITDLDAKHKIDITAATTNLETKHTTDLEAKLKTTTTNLKDEHTADIKKLKAKHNNAMNQAVYAHEFAEKQIKEYAQKQIESKSESERKLKELAR